MPSPLSSSSFDDNGDLQSAFDMGLEFGELRASTPKIDQHIEQSLSFDSFANKKGNIKRNAENVVLRIDNVPWVNIPGCTHLILLANCCCLGYHSFTNQQMASTTGRESTCPA